jgi:hypothetical protein
MCGEDFISSLLKVLCSLKAGKGLPQLLHFYLPRPVLSDCLKMSVSGVWILSIIDYFEDTGKVEALRNKV